MTIIIGTLLAALAAQAQTMPQNRLTGVTSDSAAIRMTYLLAGDMTLGNDYAVCYHPFLTNGKGDTLALDPTIFRGKRNMRYVERNRFYNNIPATDVPELPLNATQEREVTLLRSDHPWLWDGRIDVDAKREKEGCCNVTDMPQAHIGHFVIVPPFRPALAYVPDNTGKAGELQKNNPVLQHVSKYRPYDDTRILRKEEGALYVHFPLDKHTLLHDFRSNAAVLDRIEYITKAIMADTTSSVKTIQIIGLASVEGPRKRNRALAGNRAMALQRYVQRVVNAPDHQRRRGMDGAARPDCRHRLRVAREAA